MFCWTGNKQHNSAAAATSAAAAAAAVPSRGEQQCENMVFLHKILLYEMTNSEGWIQTMGR